MQEARGRIALFTDADLSAPIEEAGKLIDALDTNDVAIGSRAMDRSLISVHESPFREFAGIIFNKIVRSILWLPFVDTQCGFKAFRRERCGVIFEQQTIERFGFDPELLYLARRHGLRAVEIPVRWGYSPATKVIMLHDSFFFSSRRRHTRSYGDWSSDVCSSDLHLDGHLEPPQPEVEGHRQTG